MTRAKKYELFVEGNGAMGETFKCGKWWSPVATYDSLEEAKEGRERDRHYWGDSDPLDESYYRIEAFIE